MKEQNKKRIITGLLLIGCMISGYMLFTTSPTSLHYLRTPAHADSLIQSEFSNFNIDKDQINISSIRVDSNFSRKIYHIGVPYQFSKTQFHAELNDRFHDYGVETPATVDFPQEDMTIHLLYKGTVIRTLLLQTDPDQTYDQNRISLLILFEEAPGEELISQLESLGEPIPMVLKVENPMQANDLRKRLGSRYQRIIFWLQNKEGEDLLLTDPSGARKRLRQMGEVLPRATMLLYNTSDSERVQKIISNTKISFVNASNAVMLYEDMGKTTFTRKLGELLNNQTHSIAIIKGNETTLSWLKQQMPDFKKTGGDIIPPPKAE